MTHKKETEAAPAAEVKADVVTEPVTETVAEVPAEKPEKKTKRKSAFEYDVSKGSVVNANAHPIKYLPNVEINPAWVKAQNAKKKLQDALQSDLRGIFHEWR